ncbi:MAG: 2-oxoacid:acceptor oxidoreductase family protein [Candidatus Kapaibacteriales bacterium]
MTHESVFSGFGGQGVLTMGMILGLSAIKEGKEVTWMPSYGPEMRGGTANCITIVSDEMISSPIISKFDTVVALNQPSIDKFENSVKPNGNIIFDSTNTLKPPTRNDINIFPIPGSEIAVELKNTKVLNLIILGAFIRITQLVNVESIWSALKEILPERYHKLIPLNQEAFWRGYHFVENNLLMKK